MEVLVTGFERTIFFIPTINHHDKSVQYTHNNSNPN
jgi:hypothetical protein